MIVGLTIIVVVFAFTAQNFFTAVNFNNIITQMAGTTMLAYGVVFVLLLGEIDLSIAYLSGLTGVIVAELQKSGSGHVCRGSCRSSPQSSSRRHSARSRARSSR